ncbi:MULTISPECIES: hypothetical protein [Providencia]|uniref:Uncharacterized protein n=2 Tax=Providencia TaxID=586 RepID=A0AAI9GHT0_PROST|nr:MULTISPECIES: hypothetical protein [unclassified Providencia]EJD6474177.1 hypothetical protein [Providencia rettgeri]ELR5111926.1 hypothetical protein [Providencia stuartii]ELR5030242.1 hypothetical protein [Providencia rettgeri]ELR5216426.1 hypothetical protein [Providencia rettgeri]MBZ3681474.1 hypothetical protein [Providencia rettgeri]
MRTFQIAGYGTTLKGLTLGICKQVISATQKDAQSQVMREAQRDGLTNIRINYVREVK